MRVVRNSQSQELEQLKLQLETVNRLLDEIERRSLRRRTAFADCLPKQSCENPETRFAACVASGMSKILSPQKGK
ncbi:hypothetical protein SAMN05444321_7899 [Bradyrhizobium lablabi]|nr:hypothetical protein SAMN05444321_7899 [Bradyrhizobium lablabi]